MSIIEIKVTLEYIEPAVIRTLQVPSDIRLDRLHLTLQAATRRAICVDSPIPFSLAVSIKV